MRDEAAYLLRGRAVDEARSITKRCWTIRMIGPRTRLRDVQQDLKRKMTPYEDSTLCGPEAEASRASISITITRGRRCFTR